MPPIRETYPISRRGCEDRCIGSVFDVSVEMVSQLLEHRSGDLDNTGPVCVGVLLDESAPVLTHRSFDGEPTEIVEVSTSQGNAFSGP
jgi:hypothetical protein